MKNILIAVLCTIAFHCVQAQSNPATELANKIAQKMKDSLGLSESQKSQVYNLNMQLHNQKMQMRQEFANSNLLRDKIQGIENSRDSLYNSVLTEEQYILYRQKKRSLLKN